ncbi:hypothetical protein DAPPUDRAFT_331912 [Daphnia pulex]|uniref:Uncharacterized protein n=1 Tax=Daphnia pulex TaxID=6669 RepID=E9HNT2_DAPPU|nr:hypothetical protein DAPPUDRAFT_331912 [Daphnia pulex]|eukprot:EFX66610.1 hypothetical protein DAPPUDRAFT_331912 [Daphnia pulex]
MRKSERKFQWKGIQDVPVPAPANYVPDDRWNRDAELEYPVEREELEEQWELFRELEQHQERGQKRMQEQERELEEQDRELEDHERKLIQNPEENSRIGG